MCQMSRQAPLIENHTVDYVPLAERHGKARDLFTLWFSTNIAPLPIVTGAMVVQVFHLDLFWGLLAIALGHMVRAWGLRRWSRAAASSAVMVRC